MPTKAYRETIKELTTLLGQHPRAVVVELFLAEIPCMEIAEKLEISTKMVNSWTRHLRKPYQGTAANYMRGRKCKYKAVDGRSWREYYRDVNCTLDVNTVYYRLKTGMTVELACTLPPAHRGQGTRKKPEAK